MKKRGKMTVVQKTVKDPELISMFNSMVGASDPDPNIVIPKYERIHSNAQKVVQLLDKFAVSPLARAFSLNTQFEPGFRQIKTFAATSEEALHELQLETNDNILSGEDLQKINADPEKMVEFLNSVDSKFKIAKLGEKYTRLRESRVIKEMIMIARNIKNALMIEKERTRSPHHCLEKREALSDAFIQNCDGDFLTLFNFSNLDFKQLFYSDVMTPEFKRYTLYALYLIQERAMEIVKDITSPDIDVNKFSEILVMHVDKLRRMIPRCDKAFDKLVSSVDMLKGNFSVYYKDFITSQSSHPGVIVEHFILDVSKKHKADMQTTRQFKQILAYYTRQMNSKKIEDPRIKKMISLVSENLDILESRFNEKSEKSEKSEKFEKSDDEPEDTPSPEDSS
jgi:hypothetical protein